MKRKRELRARQIIVSVAGIGIALTLGLFIVWQVRDQEQLHERFDVAAEQASQAISREIQMRRSLVETLGAFYDASHDVSQNEFTLVTNDFCKKYDDIQAFGWVPRVPHQRRGEFESSMRKNGMESFQFTQLNPAGRFVRRLPKEEYFPLSYVEPYTGNEASIGFDMTSDPELFAALTQSRDAGKIVTVYLPGLYDDGDTGERFCMVLPVYDQEGVTYTVDGRRQSLKGFVLGLFQINVLVKNALAPIPLDGIDVELSDVTDELTPHWLYGNIPKLTPIADSSGAGVGASTRMMSQTSTIDMHGVQWRVVCTATPAYTARNRSWTSWLILTIGMVLTWMISQIIRSQFNQNINIESEVIQRTAELAKVNEALQESKDRFEQLAEQSSTFIWEVDTNPDISCVFG